MASRSSTITLYSRADCVHSHRVRLVMAEKGVAGYEVVALRDDEESLARAADVARRLADAEVPAFQDTYGWISYHREEFEEALTYLEPAAEGLPDNPVVLYHLGMTYAALDRSEEARETLQRAVDAAEGQSLPQIDRARETLEGL